MTGLGFVLVHHSSSRAFSPHVLMNPVTYLGRQPGNDLVLGSTNVSRRHAKLIVTDLGVTAHDLDSHNGIFLNGKKVRSAPVAPGDRLYIGDVCLELQRVSDHVVDTGPDSTAIHRDISDEDDPRARSLAALMRIAGVCAGADDGWAAETIQICRELVEAVVAAFVEVHDYGELDTPVILQPGTQRSSKSPILWTAVQQAIQSSSPVFSTDVVADGLAASVAANESGAVMAVPVLSSRGAVLAVLYLARGQATSSFTEVELETLGVIARIIGMRLDRDRGAIIESTNVGAETEAITRIAGLEDRIAELDGQLAAATEKVRSLADQNQALLEQADLLQQNAAGQGAEAVARLETALAEQKRVGQRDMAAVQRELAAAQTAATTAARDLAGAQEQLVLLGREVEALRAERAVIERDLESARAAEAAARATQERLGADLAEHVAAVAAERRRADDGAASTEEALARVGELEQIRDELQRRVEALQAQQATSASQARSEESLRQAMRTSVLPTIVDHVEAMANGEAPTTQAVARTITVVYVALADFDAWCERAPADIVTRHLDSFCSSVAARTQANGGRLDQVVGHGHLLVFPADTASARAAVRTALEIAAIVDADAVELGMPAPGVIAGIHSGLGVAGFFGDGDAVSYVEAGPPVVIARAAVDFAPKGHDGGARGVLVTESIRSALAGEVGFRVTRLDPSWIRGVNAPVQLSLIDLDQGGGP